MARHYKKYYDAGKTIDSIAEKGVKTHYKGKSVPTDIAMTSVPVEVTKVMRKNMDIFLQANCNIEAEKEIDIFSKTNGEVKQILTEEGESATSGDLLAQLDKKEADLALKDAQVKLENTRLLYERSQKTFSDKIISKEQFEEYKLNYQMAQVEYEKRGLELDYYTIRSPINGTVVERYIEIGDNVKEDQALFKLAKFDHIYGKVYIPEKELNKINEGQAAYISVESIPNLQFNSRVKLINPVIDPKSGTIKVTVEIIDERTALLRPGMFATVYIMIDEHQNALVIPKKALVMDSIINEVFVIKNPASDTALKPETIAYKTKIELGFSEGDEVEALSGLTEDDVVIVAGHEDLIHGSRVSIVSE